MPKLNALTSCKAPRRVEKGLWEQLETAKVAAKPSLIHRWEGRYMAVYVTGDIHSGLDMDSIRSWKQGNRGDYLIVAGDFGLPWVGDEVEEKDIQWLESRPYKVLFVDGNHERYDYLKERPTEKWHGGLVQRLRSHSILRLMRGEMRNRRGNDLCNGRCHVSRQKMWRRPFEDWWPCELPSERNFEEARAKLDRVDWKVDYVITHTCATSFLEPTMGRSRRAR